MFAFACNIFHQTIHRTTAMSYFTDTPTFPATKSSAAYVFLNPGCVTRPNRGASPSVAFLEISADGKLQWQLQMIALTFVVSRATLSPRSPGLARLLTCADVSPVVTASSGNAIGWRANCQIAAMALSAHKTQNAVSRNVRSSFFRTHEQRVG